MSSVASAALTSAFWSNVPLPPVSIAAFTATAEPASITLSLTASPQLPSPAGVKKSASPYVLCVSDAPSAVAFSQAIALPRSEIETANRLSLIPDIPMVDVVAPDGAPMPNAIWPPNHGLMSVVQVCLSLVAAFTIRSKISSILGSTAL